MPKYSTIQQNINTEISKAIIIDIGKILLRIEMLLTPAESSIEATIAALTIEAS